MWTHVSIIPNSKHEIRKKITRTQHTSNNIPTRFYYKNETKKQGCDQKKNQN